MKAFLWQADESGCGWYRCAEPGRVLNTLGHQVTWNTAMPPEVQHGDADVVVAQRTCEPGPSGIFQRMAKSGTSKMVFELDDDLFHIDPSNRRPYQFYDADRLRRMRANITHADLVTVSTPPLADVVSQWNPNVVVLPNFIPAWLLDHDRPSDDTRVTVGYGASPSHIRDFGEAARPLKRVLQRFGDAVEFRCIGEDFTCRVASNRGRTLFTPWFDSPTEYLRNVNFDVGIAPLMANPFNDAKSDIKLLELAALGIPAIVTDTGPYERAVAAGAPCRTTSTHREWETALVDLIQSPADRAQLGKEAREWAATRTIEEHAHLWAEAYER